MLRISAITFVAFATSVVAQQPIRALGPSQYDNLGWILHAIGDVDGDGRDDLAAAHAGLYAEEESCSEVQLYSGADWKPLSTLRVAFERTENGFSWTSDACGEALVVLNRDGPNVELAIGAPGRGQHGNATGAVELFGSIERTSSRARWKWSGGGAEFGAALAALPDVDNDGVNDVAVGVPGVEPGYVLVYSTKRGVALRSLYEPNSPSRFGAALAATLEVDAIAPHRRLAVGAPNDSSAHPNAGAVYLFALGDEHPVRTLSGEARDEHFGARIVNDDVDGDKSPELIVGSLGGGGSEPARVSLLDNGAKRRKWSVVLGPPAMDWGLRIAACADLDGDGAREVLVTYAPIDPRQRAAFLVLSSVDGHVVHAIRSIDPTLASARRIYRGDDLGVPLGKRMSAIDAGDQDGDRVHDVWLAACVGREDSSLRSEIALFSGRDLGAKEKPVPPPITGVITVGVGKPANVPAEPPRELVARDVPHLYQLERADHMDADSRGGACIESAFGKSIVALGDLDGDGLDDLWISGLAHGWDDYYAYVLSGATGRQLARFKGGDFAGAARIGDVDEDGRDDLALAVSERTFRFCEMVGAARIATSSTWKEFRELKEQGGAYEFASAVALVSDVDGDGARDLAVSTPATEGWGFPKPELAPTACKVELFALGEQVGTVLQRISGNASGSDGFGRALAFGGDWDGDGVGDLAIGAPNDGLRAESAGAVHVYSGATWSRLATFVSDVAGEGFGRELAWASDVDGDARAELIAAAPWSGEEKRGRVVVLSSKSRAPLWELQGERTHAAFGASLAVGDFDADGNQELVVGAPGSWHRADHARGTVSIVALREGRVLARIAGGSDAGLDWMNGVEWTSRISPHSYGEPTLPLFGRAVAIARDLDGDARPDLVIGEPTYLGPESGGAVHAISGKTVCEWLAPRKREER